MSTTYLLDTNIASHIIKGDLPAVRERLLTVPMHRVAISVVTQAELLYGVARRGHPTGLSQRVREFLARVDVLPWAGEEAESYATLRTATEGAGTPLSPMDLMIAAQAHALARACTAAGAQSVLVTRDRSFARISGGLTIEDWAQSA